MEWWDAFINWLNQNSGAAQALAMIGTVIFTAVAAWSAIVVNKRAHRKERCRIDLLFVPNMETSWEGSTPPGIEPEPPRMYVRVLMHNIGPATPLWNKWEIFSAEHRGKGRGEEPGPAPGERLLLTKFLLEEARSRKNIRLTWLEPDGRVRTVRRSYQAVGKPDDFRNRRSLLRSERALLPIQFDRLPLQRARPWLALRRRVENIRARFHRRGLPAWLGARPLPDTVPAQPASGTREPDSRDLGD